MARLILFLAADWRAPEEEDSFSYHAAGNTSWGFDQGDQSNADTLEPGYRLFKIEI